MSTRRGHPVERMVDILLNSHLVRLPIDDHWHRQIVHDVLKIFFSGEEILVSTILRTEMLFEIRVKPIPLLSEETNHSHY